jgi:sugar phosphate isomerase/epimerase
MDLGISTLVDLDLPVERLFELIRDAGFTHVSLAHDVAHAGYHLPQRRRELRAQLAALGLRLNYIHAPLLRYYDLTSLDAHVRRATLEVMRMVVAACADLGGDGAVLHVMNGPLGEGESIAARVAAGLQSLGELARFAEEQGVRLSVENLPLDIDCGVVGLAVLRAMTELRVGVCLDSCHAYIHNSQAASLVAELAPRVAHTHLSDTLGERDSHLIPGEGAVDFDHLAAALGRAGYSGVIDLECSLWMLRHRLVTGRLHRGDPPAADVAWISTPQYLAQAAAAARRIAERVEQARPAAVPA